MAHVQSGRPRVYVIGTGGSISSVGETRTDLIDYNHADRHLSIDDMLARVPEISGIAEIRAEQFMNVYGGGVTPDKWIDLARRINGIFRDDATAAGVVVTQPASTGEGATHWEVEVSADDATFYRITTLPVASGTYTDTLAPTSFSASGELSEPVTRYSLIHNPKFLATDEDRLIVAGSWEQVPLQSRVAWTPRGAAPGVGNDERLDETTDPFLDLDGAVGGELTGLGGPLQGYVYAFKDARIYKLVPTQNVNQAYIGLLVSTTTGALPRSIIPGEDEQGRPCLYFLDRRTGASRIGANGIENCGQDIHGGTWKDRVNTDASLVAHGVFYPQLQQVWWWVAVDGADTPTMKLAAHVKEFRPSPDGARRGWTVHTGPAMACLASVVYADNLEAGGARSLEVKPYVFTTVASGLINECHIGTQDNGVNYRAYARTKPYVLGDLLVKGGVLAGTIMASGGSGSSVATSLIRDFGAETSTPRVATLTPPSPGQRVIAPMDNLSLTGSYVLQVETGDAAAVNADWEIDMIALKISEEEMV